MSLPCLSTTEWISEYRSARPGLAALQSQVDQAARVYARKQEEEERERWVEWSGVEWSGADGVDGSMDGWMDKSMDG